MKRLHLHVAVKNLDQSVRFYAGLFAAEPTVRKPDYAKWMLEDPRVNFAISTRSKSAGLDHLGLQVESKDELSEVAHRLIQAGSALFKQEAASCCYARSDKAWVSDPQGIAWETFFTHGESTVYGEDEGVAARLAAALPPAAKACCGPNPDALAAQPAPVSGGCGCAD
jgi:catechol 2,3-dioxygenase-like lactoylglutathione lyase family enzyme